MELMTEKRPFTAHAQAMNSSRCVPAAPRDRRQPERHECAKAQAERRDQQDRKHAPQRKRRAGKPVHENHQPEAIEEHEHEKGCRAGR